jgi:uncharacterized membrane protein
VFVITTETVVVPPSARYNLWLDRGPTPAAAGAGMHRFAWVVQVGLGVYFVAIGVMHFAVPEGLPDQMAWMYDLPTWLHVVSGTAEILGGLGLVLPAATRIRPHLTPMAAAGLAIVMVLAALWHVPRGEVPNVVFTLVMAVVLVWLARVRWRSHPIAPRPRAEVG